MRPQLSVLPPEVISLIFDNVATSRDLLHLLLASRHCHDVFRTAPQLFLHRNVQQAVPWQVWTEFCAAQYVRSNLHQLPRMPNRELAAADEAHAEDFLTQYLRAPRSFPLSTAMADLSTAHRLHRVISYFLDDLAQRAVVEPQLLRGLRRSGSSDPRATSLEHKGQHEEDASGHAISPAERIRLYRAFLRLDMYGQLSRPARHPLQHTPHGTDVHFHHFVSSTCPSYMGEMACIHRYLGGFVADAVDALDLVFENEVRRLAAAAQAEEAPGRDGEAESQWKDLSNMCLSMLHYFSKEYRFLCAPDRVGSIASRGLTYMYTFARSDMDARVLALRKSHRWWRPFLSRLVIPLDVGDVFLRTEACPGENVQHVRLPAKYHRLLEDQFAYRDVDEPED